MDLCETVCRVIPLIRDNKASDELLRRKLTKKDMYSAREFQTLLESILHSEKPPT